MSTNKLISLEDAKFKSITDIYVQTLHTKYLVGQHLPLPQTDQKAPFFPPWILTECTCSWGLAAFPSGNEWEDRWALGATEGHVFKGDSSLPSPTMSVYSLSIYNQACDIIFFSNNVSWSDIFTADKNRKVNFLQLEIQHLSLLGNLLLGAKYYHLNLSNTMRFFNIIIYTSTPFQERDLKCVPIKVIDTRNSEGKKISNCTGNREESVTATVHGISFCACVCQNKIALFWSKGNC